MSTVKHIYVYDDSVTEFTAKMVKTGVAELPQLANTKGLLVTLYLETANRKPVEPIYVDFENISFDEVGFSNLEVNKEVHRQAVRNAFSSYMGKTETAKVPEPIKPMLPTKYELKLLKNYLSNKYPMVIQANEWFLENRINSMKVNYRKQLSEYEQSLVRG